MLTASAATKERGDPCASLANQCVGKWLDTYEFQVRGFYEKLGFEAFGTLDDHSVGQKRFSLRKRLRTS